LTAFPESITSIALVVDSGDQNQSFCLAAAAHSGRFFSIKHTTFWHQSEFYNCLWCLISLQSFSNIIVVCYPLFIVRYQSFQKWVNFISFQQQFANKNLIY